MMNNKTVSGDRFTVTYLITGDEKDAFTTARDICIEQTVEFPEELIYDSFIRNNIFGRIESFSCEDNNRFRAVISFAIEISAFELTQFLNVILGNISLKPGIIIDDITLPAGLLEYFQGPRFGVAGIRDIIGVYNRPLIATAIKPLGMNTGEFQHLSEKFTYGGIDIIKDDHGLSNQPFSAFKERVKNISDIVNGRHAGKTLYFPNITAPFSELIDRAYYAKDAGAAGVLISPALTGFDAMKHLADDKNFALPIMSHPAFIGSYLNGGTGFSHGTLLGTMMRLTGADIAVYPNFGGRFSFSKEQCNDIAAKCRSYMHHVKKIFPSPGGGMNFSNIPEMTEFYGIDTVYLMGGGLFKEGSDLAENCRKFMDMVSTCKT